MDRHAIPTLSLKPICSISPSRFAVMQSCNLQAIWGADKDTPSLLPIFPSARIGTVIHKMLQYATQGIINNDSSFDECWGKEISTIEQDMNNLWFEMHLPPLSKSTNYYHVKRRQCLQAVRFILSCKVVANLSRIRTAGPELSVESSDKKVTGRIDLVRYSHGSIEIIDYKTGTIEDTIGNNGSIKIEYKMQMKLYAAIYFSNYNKWPSKLTLVGLNNAQYDIPFSPEECSEILNEATSLLDSINIRVKSGMPPEQFANPTPSNCRYCQYRPACTAYKSTRINDDIWALDRIGTILDKKVLGNGLIWISLKSENNIYVIRGLSPERHTFFSNNSGEIELYNLYKDTAPGYHLESPMTTSYCPDLIYP